jgi:hypothetical protein
VEKTPKANHFSYIKILPGDRAKLISSSQEIDSYNKAFQIKIDSFLQEAKPFADAYHLNKRAAFEKFLIIRKENSVLSHRDLQLAKAEGYANAFAHHKYRPQLLHQAHYHSIQHFGSLGPSDRINAVFAKTRYTSPEVVQDAAQKYRVARNNI